MSNDRPIHSVNPKLGNDGSVTWERLDPVQGRVAVDRKIEFETGGVTHHLTVKTVQAIVLRALGAPERANPYVEFFPDGGMEVLW